MLEEELDDALELELELELLLPLLCGEMDCCLCWQLVVAQRDCCDCDCCCCCAAGDGGGGELVEGEGQ